MSETADYVSSQASRISSWIDRGGFRFWNVRTAVGFSPPGYFGYLDTTARFRPNTEQLAPFGRAVWTKPMTFLDGYVIRPFFERQDFWIAVDNNGWLFTGGVPGIFSFFSGAGGSYSIPIPGNIFGHGADFPERFGTNNPNLLPTSGKRGVRYTVNRRVLGLDGGMESVRFTGCGFLSQSFDGLNDSCAVALDDSSGLWFSGNANSLSVASGSPDYFTRTQPSGYESPSGFVAGTLDIRKVCAKGADVLLCLDAGGRLLASGNVTRVGVGPFDSKRSQTFYEVSGFIESINVTAAGSGYSNGRRSLTISAPDHADGRQAEAVGVFSGGSLQQVEVTQPGWGYASTPTVTLPNVSNTSPAAMQASVFNRRWSFVTATTNRTFAAVCENGHAFLWGNGCSYQDNLPALITPKRSPGRLFISGNPTFTSIALHDPFAISFTSSGGVSPDVLLCASDGTLYYQGVNPTAVNRNSRTTQVQPFSSAGGGWAKVVSASQNGFVALKQNGELWCYSAQNNLVPWSKVSGDAVFSDVFGGNFGYLANRTEQWDEFGNRVDPLAPAY
jgi:hypothetical protein